MIKFSITNRVFTFLQIILLVIVYLTSEALTLEVVLEMPRYVQHSQSATLQCRHDAAEESLRKVEWLQAGKKIFQYIKNRAPPFINFTVNGAELDWSMSNETQIHLTDLEFEASGSYSCVVSIEVPIYTKSSEEKELTVIQRQKNPPEVYVRKKVFTTGEVLEANCTSSPARPMPHITWLVNGEKVDESQIKMFPRHPELSSTVQLSMELDDLYSGHLILTCLSTIPAYQDLGTYGGEPYVDEMTETLKVLILPPACGPVTRMSAKMVCLMLIIVVFHNNYHRDLYKRLLYTE